MAPKYSFFWTIFLLLLLVTPGICRGTADYSWLDVADSEMYEIDYRGPETHSSVIPPPGHSRGRPWIHRQSRVKASAKSKSSRGGNN
ncbi:hypothetical protein Tsubulata_016768 [Turnera subulata]|uniref:Uncharacterized protein n=1 Tax=Turnera subulata TaxID=218843 RepID=A0A9Q0FCV9_9ROSI|nr:hypothetical protein Tsubulata_016768 [Turnera subulata]